MLTIVIILNIIASFPRLSVSSLSNFHKSVIDMSNSADPTTLRQEQFDLCQHFLLSNFQCILMYSAKTQFQTESPQNTEKINKQFTAPKHSILIIKRILTSKR